MASAAVPFFIVPLPTLRTFKLLVAYQAYHANRATSETLPGLLRAQDVSHFHVAANHIRSIDEANLKKREFEEAQGAKAAESPVPAPTAGTAIGVI